MVGLASIAVLKGVWQGVVARGIYLALSPAQKTPRLKPQYIINSKSYDAI